MDSGRRSGRVISSVVGGWVGRVSQAAEAGRSTLFQRRRHHSPHVTAPDTRAIITRPSFSPHTHTHARRPYMGVFCAL